ncbi:MAG: polyhydroxyalkanoate synthesis repressor PhaR [Proteobacteria bacterium]|nr:MAG: polyhydroxyalkanoate synthesis repressor PhaR [Pseudomonadota bacterium]
MSEPRVIKKYPNRRLYDTVESRYITLADIRRLVVEKVEFVVVDKKSQDDITRTILLQVIAEQEHRPDPLLSREFLSQVIRSYGGQTQAVIGAYLEQSLKLFASQQRELRDRLKAQGASDVAGTANQLAESNYQRWRSVQEQILHLLSENGNAAREAAENPGRLETQPRSTM